MSQRYITKFYLEGSVNDSCAAQDYLDEDDMTQYVDNDIRSKPISIHWELVHCDSGFVVVDAKEELTEEDLQRLSRFIKGQNSDGLGEGFEQQDFAEDYEEYELEDGTVERDYFMCSFDWRRNNYELVKIEDAKEMDRWEINSYIGPLEND